MRVIVRSAAYRLAFAISLVFALATLLLGAAILYAAHAALARQMDDSIELASNVLITEYHDEGLRGLAEAIGQRGGRPDALGYALFDAAGRRVGGTLNTGMPAPGWRNISFLDPVEGPDPARALVTRLAGGYRLVIAADLEPLEQIDRTILTLFGAAFAILLLIGLVGALVSGAYLRRRLARIEATADGIVAGDLSRRASIGPRNDEFDRVAASLNVMLDRIANLIANLRQVTSDLAHDLRTPLARLRNKLETLQEPLEPVNRRAVIDEALDQADEVLQLFDAILRISELDEGSLRRRFAPVDLCKLVRDLGETHAPLAEDVGKTLHVKAEGTCFVEGDRELIAQAMINLIENALRHSPAGTAIVLGTRKAPGKAIAFVHDTGPGIPEVEHERVLERFVRLEEARSSPGHGLGLSLVRATADVHGAPISMSNIDGFEVALHFSAMEGLSA
jgi:signal transduction histidine kinase